MRFYIQYSHNSNYDRTCNWQICRHTPSLLCHELSLTTKKPEHNVQHFTDDIYRKISNIRRTKSQNLNDSHLVLKSSLPNLWSQVLSQEWRCSWSSADKRWSNYIWVIDSLIAYWCASYNRDFTVHMHLWNDIRYFKVNFIYFMIRLTRVQW